LHVAVGNNLWNRFRPLFLPFMLLRCLFLEKNLAIPKNPCGTDKHQPDPFKPPGDISWIREVFHSRGLIWNSAVQADQCGQFFWSELSVTIINGGYDLAYSTANSSLAKLPDLPYYTEFLWYFNWIALGVQYGRWMIFCNTLAGWESAGTRAIGRRGS
jgi:hypothetical protein